MDITTTIAVGRAGETSRGCRVPTSKIKDTAAAAGEGEGVEEGPSSIGIQIDLNAAMVPSADVGDVQRSIPDTILDMLVLIDNEDFINMQAPAVLGGRIGGDVAETGKSRAVPGAGNDMGKHGTDWSAARAIPATITPQHEGVEEEDASVFCFTSANMLRVLGSTTTAGTARSSLGSGSESDYGPDSTVLAIEEGGEPARGGAWGGGGLMKRRRPVWQIAAILLARSRKGGYGRQTLWHFGILFVGLLLVSFSFQATHGGSEMLHLVFSVLVAMSMPILFMYHPLMIGNMRRDWSMSRVEVSDGLYPSVCATAKVVLDHLAVGVIGSFSAVGILHAVFWRQFISHISAPWLGVNIQLSCGATLVAWMMIALFDALAISGLPLSLTHTAGVVLNVSWSFFSGTLLIMPTIPTVLRIVTYTSPVYWGSSFMLRVMLDGLDATGACSHDSPIYCATGYGDLIAVAIDLHARRTGLDLLAMAAFTCVGLALLVVTIQTKGRRGRTLEGLR